MPGFCACVWTAWLFSSPSTICAVFSLFPSTEIRMLTHQGFPADLSLCSKGRESQCREVQNSVQHSSVFPVSRIPWKSSCENSWHFTSSTWAPSASDYFTLALLYCYSLNILQSETSSGFFQRSPVGHCCSVKTLHASTSSMSLWWKYGKWKIIIIIITPQDGSKNGLKSTRVLLLYMCGCV